MKLFYILLLIFHFSSFAQENNKINKLEGDFALEICTDTTFLNCWELYFYEHGAFGFFQLNEDGTINYEGGFFLLSDPYYFIDELEFRKLLLSSSDSLSYTQEVGTLIGRIDWEAEKIESFKEDKNTSFVQFTDKSLEKWFSKDRTQKKLKNILLDSYLSPTLLNGEKEDWHISSLQNLFKNSMSLEFYTVDKTVSRTFFRKKCSKRKMTFKKDIPIHLILTMEIISRD